MMTIESGSERVQAEYGWLDRSAVLEERNRLAREIHDTLTQDFAGILLHLEAAEALAGAKRRISSECVGRAKELARSGLEDSRRMLLGLRPKSLEGATLSNALRRLSETIPLDGGIPCVFRLRGQERELPTEVQDELYRVAQEALCNMRKHSRATFASLSLAYEPGALVLRVKDNGRGFASISPQAGGRGYGLTSMRERAHRLGAKIEIHSRPGKGTAVIISVPLPNTTPTESNYL